MSPRSLAPFRRQPGSPPLLYGHRGVRGLAPENTLAAFAHALADGADGIELDVRACGSGELVVFHDTDLTRASGGSDTRPLHEVPYHELLRLDLGDGQRVPRLSEALAWARGRRLLINVEVKGDVPDWRLAARLAARALAGVPDAPRYVMVSSFHPQILAGVRALGCPLPLAQLFHEGQRRWRPWRVAGLLPLDALHPERTLAQPDDVARARAAGRIVNVWTVNDEREARDLAGLGVDGLITDRPGAIRGAVSGVSP